MASGTVACACSTRLWTALPCCCMPARGLERLLSHPFPCSPGKQLLGTYSVPGFPAGTWGYS